MVVFNKEKNEFTFKYKDDNYVWKNSMCFKEELSMLNYGNGGMLMQLIPIPEDIEDYFNRELIVYYRELKLKRIRKKNEKK